jgi:hypothetical protein
MLRGFLRSIAAKRPESKFFYVLSLLIREPDAESGSYQTALSAKQSAIFALSAEESKILRMFATFDRFQGTEESQIRPSAADSCSILSVENRASALSRHRLPKNSLVRGIAFQR